MRKHAIAISAGEGQGELGEEQSIGRTDIEAPAIDGEGQITAPRRQKVQSGRKAERTIGLDHLLVTKDGEKLAASLTATGHYKKFETQNLGKLHIDSNGELTLTIRPDANDWKPFNLRKVTLRRTGLSGTDVR